MTDCDERIGTCISVFCGLVASTEDEVPWENAGKIELACNNLTVLNCDGRDEYISEAWMSLATASSHISEDSAVRSKSRFSFFGARGEVEPKSFIDDSSSSSSSKSDKDVVVSVCSSFKELVQRLSLFIRGTSKHIVGYFSCTDSFKWELKRFLTAVSVLR
jgi:hypothetical protein